ncbi:MAG: hypothetical protein AAGE99_02105 [Chlamydiota bacterium]
MVYLFGQRKRQRKRHRLEPLNPPVDNEGVIDVETATFSLLPTLFSIDLIERLSSTRTTFPSPYIDDER